MDRHRPPPGRWDSIVFVPEKKKLDSWGSSSSLRLCSSRIIHGRLHDARQHSTRDLSSSSPLSFSVAVAGEEPTRRQSQPPAGPTWPRAMDGHGAAADFPGPLRCLRQRDGAALRQGISAPRREPLFL